jgi:hypothetical protein
MNRPSWREFRRHRAVEQGCSLPPPAPLSLPSSYSGQTIMFRVRSPVFFAV